MAYGLGARKTAFMTGAKGTGGSYTSALQRFQEAYKSMATQGSAAVTAAKTPVSTDYDELVKLFAAGGGYGEGQNALIAEAEKAGLGSAMANLAATGMSSGSNAAGAIQRAKRDATTARLGVQDERMRLLAEALQGRAGAAENRTARVSGAYTNLASLIANMATNEPLYRNSSSYLR